MILTPYNQPGFSAQTRIKCAAPLGTLDEAGSWKYDTKPNTIQN